MFSTMMDSLRAFRRPRRPDQDVDDGDVMATSWSTRRSPKWTSSSRCRAGYRERRRCSTEARSTLPALRRRPGAPSRAPRRRREGDPRSGRRALSRLLAFAAEGRFAHGDGHDRHEVPTDVHARDAAFRSLSPHVVARLPDESVEGGAAHTVCPPGWVLWNAGDGPLPIRRRHVREGAERRVGPCRRGRRLGR
jgi:hypothetical protein